AAVCYCVGITGVDPKQIDVLFARFVSKEREEPPDIDIDFEHERREEVIQYIYRTYGKSHAALTAEVVSFQARSALREVGKACGLPHQTVDLLAKATHRWTGFALDAEDLKKIGLDPKSTLLQHVFELTQELIGFPRHLAQHVGGFIISEQPLHTLVPVCNAAMENRYIIEWNKDDIEALGMFKIDILALGMLTCIRKALDLVNQHRRTNLELPLSFSEIPQEDCAVYDMLCAADTVGVFQVESRAQMSMLPRLKPRCFYDIVIEIAIVRPGPIQGKMVHPYLKRREGKERFDFPDERVASILGKTFGVPIFQEQAMRLAIILAEFTPGEAEALRRAMAAWKTQKSKIADFKKRIIKGMQKNGYSLAFAETCLKQIQGFSEYGFPESHAVSFALLVYVSAWIKRSYPAEFAAALLNSQPMGFYQPAQIVSDAKKHAVKILPISITKSSWDSRIEYTRRHESQLRLGMHLVKGLQETQVALIRKILDENPRIQTIQGLWQKGKKLQQATLIKLAHADAFSAWGYARRDASWEIQALPSKPQSFDHIWSDGQTSFSFMRHSKAETLWYDYEHTGLSLHGHPLELARSILTKHHVASTQEIRNQAQHALGKTCSLAGLVLFRQRPGTSKGVVFLTLEDEFGVANVVVMPPIFQRFQKVIIQASCIIVSGVIETNSAVLYMKAEDIQELPLSSFQIHSDEF
ncbi:MAG: error-prone DNA polymerase, partial [Bdellovibrionales bacterium]|nr:error-prone DNA polymerase [Bdellovibrionales bacterium]